MSSAVFFHNFNEINFKLWAVASVATATLATFSFVTSQADSGKILCSLLSDGTQAESSGQYKQARLDFDLALLQARTNGDKKTLITTLIDSARIDNEFEEDKLAISLAQEALTLSKGLYGQNDEHTAEAMAALADVLGDDHKSLSLYKDSLSILRQKCGSQDQRVARILMEMSYCYEAIGAEGSAISTIKASLRSYERGHNSDDQNYAKALVQYANLVDIDPTEKEAILKQALAVQENSLGKNHPALSTTLNYLAANEIRFPEKEALLRRAWQIDETVFGSTSVPAMRDMAALADAFASIGKAKEASDLRRRVAAICSGKGDALSSMSTDFLDQYAKLLHELKFESQALKIDAAQKDQAASRSTTKASAQSSTEKKDDVLERENDPEYWQRTEMVPIGNVQKFRSEDYDHIQLWYDKGALNLEAFREGEIVWKAKLGECPTGILNAKADKDTLAVSWLDGDGPTWHNDVYKISKTSFSLLSSGTTDAYAQQINEQVDEVLSGDTDAVNAGGVESVPASYINNNFIADTIQRGQHKALLLYGQGDAAAAAEMLGHIFDLTQKAIDTKRDDSKSEISRYESWLDSWEFQEQPLSDFIPALNDYGFYLQQAGCLKESAEVLLQVTKACPQRALAHLNLADTLWSQGKLSEARASYVQYLSLLGGQTEKQTIPARVLQRVANTVVTKAAIVSPVFKISIPGV